MDEQKLRDKKVIVTVDVTAFFDACTVTLHHPSETVFVFEIGPRLSTTYAKDGTPIPHIGGVKAQP